MVWTVSQTASTLTLTPDGTTSTNLSDLLDLAISTLTTTAGVTKPTLYTYDLTKNLLIGADTSNNYLYVSGIELIVRSQFIRASNSRVRFVNINVAGAVVGKANIILSNNPNSNFYADGGLFTSAGGNNTVSATDLTLIYRRTNGNSGAVINGFDVGGRSTGNFSNCSFQSDSNADGSNAVFYFGTETYTNCSFLGWAACEITQAETLFKNCQFTTVSIVKNSNTGNYYFENVAIPFFQLRSNPSVYFTDCTVGGISIDSASTTNLLDYRNSLQLLGSTNESNGLLVVRFPDNTQIYKRTLSATGQISGGNSTGATIGVTSSSDRLLISALRQTSNSLTSYDCRGLWEGVFVKYGRLPAVFSLGLQGTTATLQSVPFSSLPDTGITVSNSATVAAYTTIAINHATSLVTISGATTKQQLHDYCALEKASFADSGVTLGANPVPKCCLPNLGSPIYSRSVGTFLYNLSISASASLTGTDSVTLAAGKNITLAAAGTYSTSPIGFLSGGMITASVGGSFNIQGWTGSGTTISSSAPSIFTVDNSQISNFIAGTNVTIQAPVVSISAPNFAQNTRVQVARLEPYSVPSTAITTATSIITITGNRFKSAAPATLVYFQLQAGATIPTTTPQIANNTLYFVQASGVADSLTAGQFKLSLTQSGAAIAFSTQGTGSFTLTGITELDNSLAGASGYSVAFTEPNNTLLRVSAQFWQNTTGCTATNFYQSNILWNLASGNAIADTVNANSNPDLIHNALVGNATKVFSTNVVLPSDGSIVTGILFNAQGTISLDPRLFASVAGFPTLTPQAAYLYTVYYRSTLAGIRIIGNQFTAQDAANFVFAGLKLDNIADGVRNTPNTPATIAGGYVATADGSNPISITSGAIYINADRRAVPVTTAGGTVAPTQQQLRDAQALPPSAGVVAAPGSIDSKLDNAGGDFIDL